MSHDDLMAARAEKLAGLSPRKRGELKAREAMDWIYRWGWASPKTIDFLSGAERRGLASRLVKRGLIQATRTVAGGAVAGVPVFYLTLTATGQAEVERWRSDLLPYQRDPYRVRQDQLRHYQLAQWATARAVRDGSITSFETESELAQKSDAHIKQADIVWYSEGLRIGVEVELTAKWKRDLDEFVLACLLAVNDHEYEPQFDHIAIVSDSPAILRRYKEALTPGAIYWRWEKDHRGQWKRLEDGKCHVPKWAEGKFWWQLIE